MRKRRHGIAIDRMVQGFESREPMALCVKHGAARRRGHLRRGKLDAAFSQSVAP